jgi:hypothetical protein
MKKFTFCVLVLGLALMAGCHQPTPQPAPTDSQKLEIEVKPAAPAAPPVVVVPPAPPVRPSDNYLAGYNDAYYKQWLSPIRWSFSTDYRAGWGAGKFDRDHGIPHKYPK